MFENLTLVIVIIVIFWLGAYGFYLYTSRQQKDIVDDLDRLNKKCGIENCKNKITTKSAVLKAAKNE